MVSTLTDRINGVNGGVAQKVPVLCATTVNITLEGEQTIDDVTTDESRVLVKDQDDLAENGLWITSSGSWTRPPDGDGNRDLVRGSEVYVTDGTVNGNTLWSLRADTDPIVVGTTEVTFQNFTEVLSEGLLAVTLSSPQDGEFIRRVAGVWTNFDLAAANMAYTGNNSFAGNTTLTGKVISPTKSILTIAADAITVTGMVHTIANEGGAALDTLSTINGGADGQILILSASDATDVTLIDEAGNISLDSYSSVLLSGTSKSLTLVYRSAISKWVELSVFRRVEQVLQATIATTQTTTSTSYVDVTSLTQVITPQTNDAKILVSVHLPASMNGADSQTSDFRIVRTISAVDTDITGDIPLTTDEDQSTNAQVGSYTYLDSPATTTAVTYRVQAKVSNASSTLSLNTGNKKSVIILQEKFV